MSKRVATTVEDKKEEKRAEKIELIPQETADEICKAICDYDLEEIMKLSEPYDMSKFKSDGKNGLILLMQASRDIPTKVAAVLSSSPKYRELDKDHFKQRFPNFVRDYGDHLLEYVLSSTVSLQEFVKKINSYFNKYPEYKADSAAAISILVSLKRDCMKSSEKIKKIIDYFLKAGVSLDEHRNDNWMRTLRCFEGSNPLAIAVESGNIDFVGYFLLKGADAHTVHPDGDSDSPISQIICLAENDAGRRGSIANKILKIFLEHDVKPSSSFRKALSRYIESLSGSQFFGARRALISLQEELTAMKHSQAGSFSLFWQSAKILADSPQNRSSDLPKHIRKAVDDARPFIGTNG